jgi:histidinol-phosphatase (PHP family)
MIDSHLHLYPHQFPDHTATVSPPSGPYPLERIEEYVRWASTRGVSELVFTEHLYRCVESEEVLGPFWEQQPRTLAELTEADVRADRKLSLERYVDVVQRAKDAGFPVRLGLEVDFFPETIAEVLEFLSPYPFDVLIGSVHWIDGWGFDRPHAAEEWERRGHRLVYEQYFDLAATLAATAGVDVLTHPDRVKMRGYRLPEEPIDLYEDLVSAALAGGVAVELNSGGLRHPVEEVYPTTTLLEMFGRAGLDLTLASDAHAPDGAGWRFDQLRAMALDAGFTHVARFELGRRSLRPLQADDDTVDSTGSRSDSAAESLRARLSPSERLHDAP